MRLRGTHTRTLGTEWGQVSILDALAKYEPPGAKEAESIIERVSPRLQHANSAVVMSAVKVILKFAGALDQDGESMAAVRKKLAPPLVTLLNSEPEICYVALRNINLIVQHDDRILEGDMKVRVARVARLLARLLDARWVLSPRAWLAPRTWLAKRTL
jgi:vesicle coat complex subunit